MFYDLRKHPKLDIVDQKVMDVSRGRVVCTKEESRRTRLVTNTFKRRKQLMLKSKEGHLNIETKLVVGWTHDNKPVRQHIRGSRIRLLIQKGWVIQICNYLGKWA